jgi:glucosamine-6-phosphate deaminase
MAANLMNVGKVDQLSIHVFKTNKELGQAAAFLAVKIINEAIDSKGVANIILATGNSQLSFLNALKVTKIDWSKVRVFHMDEYIGIDPDHPASFPNFLRKQLIDYVHPKDFFPLSTQKEALEDVCREYEALLYSYPADLCALGIGENGHLAFNDPPYADFNDPEWVKIVKLDDTSRLQQVGEGHFSTLDAVPTHAVTLTIPALLAAKHVFVLVPEHRKTEAVYLSLTTEISPNFPATILRKTPHAQLFVDLDSAAKIIQHGEISIQG